MLIVFKKILKASGAATIGALASFWFSNESIYGTLATFIFFSILFYFGNEIFLDQKSEYSVRDGGTIVLKDQLIPMLGWVSVFFGGFIGSSGLIWLLILITETSKRTNFTMEIFASIGYMIFGIVSVIGGFIVSRIYIKSRIEVSNINVVVYVGGNKQKDLTWKQVNEVRFDKKEQGLKLISNDGSILVNIDKIGFDLFVLRLKEVLDQSIWGEAVKELYQFRKNKTGESQSLKKRINKSS